MLLYVRRVKESYIPHKGLHHSVSWGLARTAALRPAELVCDPCCGTASLLVEAREYWPHASYIGCDLDRAQLAKAAANVRAQHGRRSEGVAASGPPSMPIALAEADCGALPLRDASVDCFLSDLPFGRQHGSIEDNLATLYPRLLGEIGRALRPHTGRAVLLTAAASAGPLIDADGLATAGLRHVDTQPLRFCNIDCVMVLLHHASAPPDASAALFDFAFRQRAGDSATHTWKMEKPMLKPRQLAP